MSGDWWRRLVGDGGSAGGGDWRLECARMVETQIAARGIRDPRILDALRRVPRHRFVPDRLRGDAYADRAVGIGSGQTISQPYIVAVMTAALDPQPGDRVLEVGTGSGYQAAVLAGLVREVVSVERHADLSRQAAARLADLGLANVRPVVGDASLGWPDGAPWDGILVTAAAPEVPPALTAQLADGGRLVIPVGPRDIQRLTVVRRQGDALIERFLDDCVFVPLLGEGGWPA